MLGRISRVYDVTQCGKAIPGRLSGAELYGSGQRHHGRSIPAHHKHRRRKPYGAAIATAAGFCRGKSGTVKIRANVTGIEDDGKRTRNL